MKIIKSKRRTISIEVGRGGVVVRSPHYASELSVRRFVQAKHSWIEKKLSEQRKAQRRRAGKVVVLGKKYNVVFLNSKDKKVVFLKNKAKVYSDRNGQATLLDYISDLTEKEVTNIIDEKYNLFTSKKPKLFFKKYKSKWGSCAPSGSISFNLMLSMAPRKVIEYVVIHELVHLRVKNHSRHYWSKVEKYIPDYKQRRAWFRENRDMLEL